MTRPARSPAPSPGRRRAALAMLAALAGVLPGCANLAPDYRRPAAPLPAGWLQGASPLPPGTVPTGPGAAPSDQAVAAPDATLPPPAELGWRDFFQDDRLRQVVALALDNNRDLRVAALNIAQARAQYGIQRAAQLPTVNATATGIRQRTLTATGTSVLSQQYSVGLGFASWEIDFFDRIGNLSEAALQTFFSTAETRRSVQIALVADTANAWLTLATDQRRLRLAQETLRSQQASYDLTRRARDLGAESGLTLAQARTTVDAARGDVAAYTRQVAQDRNALALLVGAVPPPELLPPGGEAADDIAAVPQSALVAVPAGLPSEVLQGRPDVGAAERALQAANARIGAARAAFFPSIRLTASGGSASRELSGLFGSGSGLWSFSPQIVLPIFTAGALRASLDVAEIGRDITVAQYEKTLQSAFREASDALAARETLGEQIAAQQSLRDATATALRLSQARFRTGLDSYLDVLVTQRSYYTAGQNLITLQLAEQANRITLYRVLGGGWRETTEPAAGAVE